MLKASLQGKLNLADYYVEIISADNEKQAGEYFKAFIDLINSNKSKIKKLVIIDTSFLHRHYDTKYSNETVKTEWLKDNEKYLSRLLICYEYIRYSEIVKSRFYDPHLKLIKLDYSGDENGDYIDTTFRSRVKSVSDNFLHKGALKDIVKFLLDETAGYRALIEFLEEKLIKELHDEVKTFCSEEEAFIDPSKLKMVLSYSGGLNQCITYAMEKRKLSTKINYEEISYRFRGSPALQIDASSVQRNTESITQSNIYSPTFFSRAIAYHIDLIGIEPKHQPALSVKVIQLVQNFKEEVISNDTKYNSV